MSENKVSKAMDVLKVEKETCEFRMQKIKERPWMDERKKEQQIEYLKSRKRLIKRTLQNNFSNIKELLEYTKKVEKEMDNPLNRKLRQGILSNYLV